MVCLASKHVRNAIEKNVKINRLAIFSIAMSKMLGLNQELTDEISNLVLIII